MRWYIQVHGLEEGPYTLDELKRDYRVHPMLPVHREGEEEWIPAIKDPLLEKLFKEERPHPFPKEEEKPSLPETGEVITIRRDPPYYIFWIMFLLFLFLLWLYRYFQ